MTTLLHSPPSRRFNRSNQISVRLTPDIEAALIEFATRERRTISSAVNAALARVLVLREGSPPAKKNPRAA
jgi:hypothetical protein